MRGHASSTCFRTAVLAMAFAAAIFGIPGHPDAVVPLTPISGYSPYPDGGDPNNPLLVTDCNGGPQIGVLYRNSETEPYIAVNPTNPDNMIACWHQDRWSNGSAQGVGCAYTMDGGSTWTEVVIPFTRCSGARPGAVIEFERASDPWLTFGPDGACYYMALVSDRSTPRNGMAVAKSRNGGRTWSRPRIVAIHDPMPLLAGGDPGPVWSQPGMVAPHDDLNPGFNDALKRRWSGAPEIRPLGRPTTRGYPGAGDDDDDSSGNDSGDDDDSGDNDDSGDDDSSSDDDSDSSDYGDDDDDDDGGPPVDPNLYVFHDKNSMTADPYNRRFVYATWTLFIGEETQLVFSRSKDGGRTWSRYEEIARFHDVDENTFVGFRQGAQIVVLPDGTLVNSFFRYLYDKTTLEWIGADQAVFRSFNKGKTWEQVETRIATFLPTGGVDAEMAFIHGVFIPVRDAGSLPDIAVNRRTGDIYVVWQDGSLSEFGASSVVISRSTDGGTTWSQPVPVHGLDDPSGMPVQAFLPAVAVAEDGTVAVLFYDFRNDVFFDGPLSTDVWMALLTPDLTPKGEVRVTDESFDMRQMVLTGDRGYFPGDYVGLDAVGNEFVAAFTVANDLGLPLDFPQDNTVLRVDSNNRQDIVFGRVSSSAPSFAGIEISGEEPRPLHEDPAQGTARYALHAAAPNPFNAGTTIPFELGEASSVRLDIFDVAGRRIRTLVGGEALPTGEHTVTWDGRTQRGEDAASGIYFYRIKTAAFTETRRMVLMR